MLIKILDGTNITDISKCSEKRVEVKCDKCDTTTETTYANYYRTQEKRKFDGKTQCRKCGCKETVCKRVTKSTKGITRPHLQKASSPNWKGGRYIDAHGYVMIHIGNNLKVKSKWESYKKEHTALMETKLKRKLVKGEQVHHIDGDRQNNIKSNLVLMKSSKEHRDSHQSLQEIGYQLVRTGLVSYDFKKKRYVAHEKLRKLLGHP